MTKKQKVVFAVVAAVLAVVAAVIVNGSIQSVSGVPFRRYGYRFTRFLLSDP